MGRPKAGIEGFRPLGGWGLAKKTGVKHGQRATPANEFQAPPPVEEELSGGGFPVSPQKGCFLALGLSPIF